MFQKIGPTQLNCGVSDAWSTCTETVGSVALSDILPSDTICLFLHIRSTAATNAIGFRKPGSTDDRTQQNVGVSHLWIPVAVDSNIHFEYWLGNHNSQLVYLVGYMTSESGVMFTNATQYGGTNWSWVEKDLSVLCPNAIGIIFETVSWGGFWGIRPGDSTQDRYQAGYEHEWGVVGCSATQTIDIYVGGGSLTQYFYILGYITQDATFLTDAEDISLGSTGSYVNIDLSDKDGVLAFIDVVATLANVDYALREDGSSEDFYYHLSGQHNWGIPAISDAGFIEGKIENTVIDFWLVGTADKPLAKAKSHAFVIG